MRTAGHDPIAERPKRRPLTEQRTQPVCPQQTERSEQRSQKHAPERRCIVSGEVHPQSALLRFAVGPDGQIIPDLKGTLPGRGLWLTPTRKAIEEAQVKRVFARAARQSVTVPDQLADLIENQLRQNGLNLLGLARKAGDLVAGFEKVKALIGSGKATLLVTARDAAEDGKRKIYGAAPALPVIDHFTAAELSLALGRENVVHAAVRRSGLAERLLKETTRLEIFNGIRPPFGVQKGEDT